MHLDRPWIESCIPHHGSMCLLDEVVGWDAERITCSSSSHRSADNPLRARGRLGIACGIEYAAQAMAVHGALLAGVLEASRNTAPPALGSPAAGFLAGVRDVRFHVSRLDDVQGVLICDAVRIAGDRATALYEFELRCAAMRLLRGRAAVVLDAHERLQIV
ncbi:MAG: hydroxymyristoyl-ACP dehydratase [Pseudomonadota bacterium]|nr:hydroxymyristoyl-ACP dehydratase [Pseudomonadota bacterium]